MKTLYEFQNEVAINNGWQDWASVNTHLHAREIMFTQAAELYATHRVEEAVREKSKYVTVVTPPEMYWKSVAKELKDQLAAKDKEIEQLREALATVTKEQLQATVKAQLSGNPGQFTGPVVGIEDDTEFNNAKPKYEFTEKENY